MKNICVGVNQLLVDETLTIDVIFNQIFIFTEIGFQKGARNWFFQFCVGGWKDHCVGGPRPLPRNG